MSRNKLCSDCKNYNYGWCYVRKTNKDLNRLISCRFKVGQEEKKRNESCENCKYRVGIDFSNGYMFGCSMFYEVFGNKNISILQGDYESTQCEMWESEEK